MYNGRLSERVSTPSMLATYVNITNNMDNERKTNRAKKSKQKQTKHDCAITYLPIYTNVNKLTHTLIDQI